MSDADLYFVRDRTVDPMTEEDRHASRLGAVLHRELAARMQAAGPHDTGSSACTRAWSVDSENLILTTANGLQTQEGLPLP